MAVFSIHLVFGFGLSSRHGTGMGRFRMAGRWEGWLWIASCVLSHIFRMCIASSEMEILTHSRLYWWSGCFDHAVRCDNPTNYYAKIHCFFS